MSRAKAHFKLLALIFLLCLFGLSGLFISDKPLFAQTSYHYKIFDRTKGLSGNWVKAILEDSKGNIWFATNSGVSRFDGIWKNYTKSDGLIDNDVNAILEDQFNNIWFATAKGISRLSVDGKWHSFSQADGLVNDQSLSINSDKNGRIWIGTQFGISTLDSNNSKGFENQHQVSDLILLGVRSILSSKVDELWIGVDGGKFPGGVGRFDGRSWEVFRSADGLAADNVRTLAEDKDGNIWVGTNAGVSRFDGRGWSSFRVQDGLISDDVQTLAKSSDGHIWVGTPSGLSRFDGKGWVNITETRNMANIDISAILEDSLGNLWIGTKNQGVIFTDRSWQLFSTISGLASNTVFSMAQDTKGNIWFATSNGLSRFDTKSKSWSTFTTANGLPDSNVQSVIEDKRSHIWVGTAKGIGEFDGKTWKIYDINNGLPQDRVHLIFEDSKGNIWAASGLFLRGGFDEVVNISGWLSKFDGNSWKNIPVENAISSISEDSSGNIWAATFGGGVMRIRGEKVDRFTSSDGLAHNVVYSTVEIEPNVIWFGTADGVSIFNSLQGVKGVQGGWRTISTADGLADNIVRSILKDNQGLIWLATPSGISLFDNKSWSNFTIDDGLISNDSKLIFESFDGSIWISSNDSKGVTRHLRERTAPQTVIITAPRGIVGSNSVLIEFDGGDARTPKDQLLFSSRLDLNPWSLFSAKRFFNTPPLPDGRHIFAVRAKDKDGNIDPTPATVEFIVDATPPVVKITDPTEDQIIGGVYKVAGIATDTDFKEYEVEGPNFTFKSDRRFSNAGVLAVWDTKSLKDGKYTIRLSATDTKDGEYDTEHPTSTTVSVQIDNTPPEAEILSPRNGDEISGKTILKAKVFDLNLESYTFTYRQTETSLWRQISFDRLMPQQKEFEVVWDSSNIYGMTVIQLQVFDKAGNQTVSEVTVNLQNSGAKPQIIITSPVASQVINSNYPIVGTVEDATLKEFKVEYKAKAINQQGLWNQVAKSAAVVRDGSLAVWNTTSLPDGEYLLRIEAQDDNDYTSEVEIPISIDNTPPEAKILRPIQGEIVASSPNIDIVGVADDVNFSLYRIEFGEGLNPQRWKPIGDSVQTSTENGTLAIWNASGLEGEYTLRLTVEDKGGLKSNAIQVISFDDQIPDVKILSPKEGEIVFGRLPIVGSVQDRNFVGYELSFKPLSSETWMAIELPKSVSSSAKVEAELGIWDTPQLQLSGEFFIRLAGRDKSGHIAEAIRRVIVDNKPPEVSIIKPVNYEQVSQEVKIVGTVDDENLQQYIVEYGVGTAPTNWNSVSELPFVRRDNLLAIWDAKGKVGTYIIRLRAIDKAKNESSAEVAVLLMAILDSEVGGISSDNEGAVTIQIPPHSLPNSMTIRINPVPPENVSSPSAPSISFTGIAYDLEPASVKLKPNKPATISLKISTISGLGDLEGIDLGNLEKTSETHQLRPNRLALFWWDESNLSWKFIGGSLDRKQMLLRTAVTRLGRYAIMKIPSDPSEAMLDSSKFNLTCQPRVFSPRHGTSSITNISFNLMSTLRTTVKIYNNSGRLCRMLRNDVIMPSGSNVVCWDGKDDDSQFVPTGAYIVVIETEKGRDQKSVIVWNK